MPRDYGLVQTSIWSEMSVQCLTVEEQRAYLLVYLQPNLNRCGVVPFTLRRWAGMSQGDTPKRLRAALAGLESRRMVAIDENTEELFVRTYVRWDGLLTQPQVVGAMVRDFRTIGSPTLAVAFLDELRRIWHLPIKDGERRGLRIALGLCENDKQRESVGEGLAGPLALAIEQGLVQPFDLASLGDLPVALGHGSRAPSRSRPYPGPGPGPLTRPSDEVRERSCEVELAAERARAAS